MLQRFSYEHNIEHGRSKLNARHLKLVGKIYLESIANYANLVIEDNKIIYSCTNCGIIAVVMGIILSIIGNFLRLLKSIIGKILSIIGRGLNVNLFCKFQS